MTDAHLQERLPEQLPDNPMHWAASWLDTATAQAVQRNPNAMNLATIDVSGRPSSRIVLCKDFVAEPGYLVFYTNYESRKCQDITANKAVAVAFHWDSLGRQVRLEGIAVRSPAAESDAYFATRHTGSQLGAWGSDQSRPIESRAALESQLAARADQLKSHGEVPRPPHWGGLRIWPDAVELWIEGGDRIHDRARWTRELVQQADDQFRVGVWTGSRLQP